MERNDKIHIIIISQAAAILVIFILLFCITQFAHIDCSGCPLCGMTHAFRCMFRLDFETAKLYNERIYSVFSFFLILGIDLIFSAVYLLYNKIKNYKSTKSL